MANHAARHDDAPSLFFSNATESSMQIAVRVLQRWWRPPANDVTPIRDTGTAPPALPRAVGNPHAVSAELGRFLDWLADETVREMLAT